MRTRKNLKDTYYVEALIIAAFGPSMPSNPDKTHVGAPLKPISALQTLQKRRKILQATIRI